MVACFIGGGLARLTHLNGLGWAIGIPFFLALALLKTPLNKLCQTALKHRGGWWRDLSGGPRHGRRTAANFVLGALALPVALAGCEKPELTWERVEEMIARDYPSAPTRGIEEVRHELEAPGSDVLLVDVREEEEYAVSHLPGAIHEQDIDRIALLAEADPERPVILYCSVGYRSTGVAKQLHERGHGNIHNLRGSIFAWANRGLPLIGPDGPTREVHPYDAHWGQLLERSQN
ncbi:MAG: rhodanese-like domain-containing protein [Opitutales bacterium]